MIIKSMTRKQASFGQLLAYFERGRSDERFRCFHHLYAQGLDGIQTEFEQNAQFLRKREGGVFLYHEIVSIQRASRLSEHRQKELLFSIAKNYLLSRAPRSLAYGVLHDDRDGHLHYHLMISGNEVGGSERTRISKAAFAEIKRQLEAWVLERFPELEQAPVMAKAASGEKWSRAGGELKRRTGKTPEREALKARLLGVFAAAQHPAEFFQGLAEAQVRVYVRGQSIGFEDLKTGRKHRLKTLGLEAAFQAVNARIRQSEAQHTAQASPQAAEAHSQDQNRNHDRNHAQAQAKAPAEPSSGMSEAAIAQARQELEAEARIQQAREPRRRGPGATVETQECRAVPEDSEAFVGEEMLRQWEQEAQTQASNARPAVENAPPEVLDPSVAYSQASSPEAVTEQRRQEAARWREGQTGTETDAQRKR